MNIKIGLAASSHLTKARQALAALTGALSLFATTAFGGGGAIYTSGPDGLTVNQNIYSNKADVYLNGGPQNANASGLDDGMYYFQVTDPSGTHLLSTDDASNRRVQVTNGVIAGSVGTPTPHATGTANAVTGTVPVQLLPFADTPNSGGEYKVWLIGPVVVTHHNGGPNGAYDSPNVTINTDDPKVLAFSNGDAVTDNFKVIASTPPPTPNSLPITLSGMKYYDLNANGVNESGEVGVVGVQIEVTFALSDSSTIVKTTTTGTGGIWSVIAPNGTDLAPGVTVVGFTACEVQPAPNLDGSFWLQTGPLIGDQSVNPHVVIDNLQNYCWTGSLLNVASNITGLDFGNICVHQPSGGFTLGYWSNKNGEATLKAVDPAWRTLLTSEALRRSSGDNFDVPALPQTFGNGYKEFRTWILGATATNMAYMLSAQLAATTLDTSYKGLPASTLLYLPSDSAMQTNLAECYGANVVSIGTVMSEANTELGLHNITTSPSAYRDHQECLKNILDNVNNNKLLFVSPTPCAVVYPQ